MSREKHTFTSSEIAHIWAHGRATWGKSPGNLSFSGDAISSYATEMARFIEHNGKRAVIINETSYSVTTAKSQGRVRQAIPNYVQKFYIGDIGMGCSLNFYPHAGAQLFKYAIEQATFWAGKAKKARQRKEFYQGEQHTWLERAKEVSDFFELGETVDEGTIERLREAAERAAKQAAEERRIANEKRQKELQEDYEAWKRGEDIYAYTLGHAFPVAFRIEGNEVVSTMGARIPISEARLAIRFIRKHRESGWRTNGEKFTIGGYQLIQISEKEIHVGCHHISWEEFDRIAPIIQEHKQFEDLATAEARPV
jgi:hypothetical protein